jgi:hypothetical protein
MCISQLFNLYFHRNEIHHMCISQYFNPYVYFKEELKFYLVVSVICISRKNWSFTLRCLSFVFQGWTEVLPCGVCRLYFKEELKFYLVVSVVCISRKNWSFTLRCLSLSLEHELWHDLCEQNPQNEMFAVKIHTPNSDCYLLELFCCVF